jgi:hypothetical protein
MTRYSFLQCWPHIWLFTNPNTRQSNGSRSWLQSDRGSSHHSSESSPCTVTQCQVAGSFSSLNVCHTVHSKVCGAFEGNGQQWRSALMGKTQLICFLQHHKRQFPLSWMTRAMFLTPPSTTLCDDVPCSVLSFLDQWVETIVFVPYTLYIT